MIWYKMIYNEMKINQRFDPGLDPLCGAIWRLFKSLMPSRGGRYLSGKKSEVFAGYRRPRRNRKMFMIISDGILRRFKFLPGHQ
jgi:hypothetical protein